ncbi:UNKNOWN [Stylonychia lemnae]|uniref:DOMON domain-containing protein n=1 Tax=Stylonychia lemnae TaxID=5949 RepID=A0A078B9Q8_STYLE|nr:UNKNOWN [Stylonychia lemnae]|eukprot:CDW91169.1 UNKNOWN [Stylonychia lemnae]
MISIRTATLAALFSLTLAQNSTVNTVYNLQLKTGSEPLLQLDYSIDNSTTPIRLNQTLRITGFNTSAWNTGTGNGMYVGIGYGCDEMENCDMIICSYMVTGNFGAATDKFSCSDYKTDPNKTPVQDQGQDIYNVSTLSTAATKTATVAFTKNNFAVRFVRPFTTSNSNEDYQLGKQNTPIIFAMGYYASNTPIQHTAGMYGLSKLDLTMAPIAGSAFQGMKLALGLIATVVLSLNFF